MSEPTINSLNNEKIQQLLAAVGVESDEDTKHNIDAFDHNWQQPHYFNKAQLEMLDNFTAHVVTGISEKFTQIYKDDHEVKITSKTQLYANKFITSGDLQNDYYLAFGTDQDQIWGVVGIPSQTAGIWTTQLLGDGNPEDKSEENSEEHLSELEISLLLDIAAGAVEAFSNSHEHCDLKPIGVIAKGQLPFHLEGTEELYKIVFNVNKADSENASEAYFLVPCDKLMSIVGQDVQADEDIPQENYLEAMISHIQQMPLSVVAKIDEVVLSFNEIMSLGTGDILMLSKKTNEPIDLLLESRPLFRGRLAKSAGNYAIVITETA